MIDEQARHLAEYRLQKAKTLQAQSELLLNNAQYDGSINRSYYAIFNATRALLALLRLDSQRHSGVISYFDRYFVKTGVFEKQYSKFAHTAFDTRQDNDYEDFYEPSQVEAQEQHANAVLFINEVEDKLEQFLQGKLSAPSISSP
jgi:uncharacterized protein (UPF0332 family)